MTGAGPGGGYEEVRERLRERGYLQGPIERFVLRDVAREGAAALIRTALKAALLGAPVLGALLAGVAVAVNRPLVGTADAVLLWAYFSAAALAVLAVLDLGVAAVSVRRARARSAGRRTAAVVGLAVVVYLGALWWARAPGIGRLADLAFLAAAVAVASAVGALARLVSLAAVVRRTGDLPARTRAGLGGVVVLTLAAAAAFLVLPRTAAGGGAGQAASPFSAPTAPARAVMLGIDGLDADLVRALEPEGAVDDLLAVFAAGAVHPIARSAGLPPPAVWTSLTTGMPVRVHGVLDVESRRLPGVSTPIRPGAGPVPFRAALALLLPTRTVPTSGVGRSVRTLWEIVGLRRPTAAIGWWASWPAVRPEAGGYAVSDRVLAKLLAGGDPEDDTDPPSLFERLRNDFDADRVAIRAEFAAAFGGVRNERVRDLAWDAFLIDAHALRVLRRLWEDPAVEFGAAYLPGLDIVRQRLGEDLGTAAAPAELLAGAEAIRAYAAWLGRSARAWVDPGRPLIVVGDPGRSFAAGDEGMLAVVGPSARPACVGPSIGTLTVAPTILRALGYPRSGEMPPAAGGPCWEGPEPTPPVVETFGRRAVRASRPTSAYDDDLLERLRSLGYVD